MIPGNRSVDVGRRVVMHVLAHDWDAVAAIYHEGAVWEDRRPGLQSSFTGREQFVKLSRAVGRVTEVDSELLATRGESLSLTGGVWTGQDAGGGRFEVETLRLFEIDETGLGRRVVVFAPDDEDAAFAELDHRFAEGEAAPCRRTFDLTLRFIAAYDSQDWDALREILHPDIEIVDRRPMAFGVRTIEDYIRTNEALHELAPGHGTRTVAYPRIGPSASVGLFQQRGSYGDGSAFEREFAAVAHLMDGQVTRLEYFAGEAVEDAVARFDELY